jgi:sugar/nucleoside kinase (ribokinase family)
MSVKKKESVLVVGELNIDLILNKIDKFPEMGKEVLAQEMKQTLGSSAAIFANNLSILGANVSFLGKVGNDGYADQVNSALKSAGVDVSNILVSATHLTGITVIFNFGNNRAMVTYPGAMNDLKIQDISDDVLESASHMHLSSVFLQEGLKPDIVELFKRAKSHNLTTSFDPQWDPSENWDLDLEALLPYVDIFLPNETEIKFLTKSNTIEEALDKIKPFCNVVIVKNGISGVVMWDKSKVINKPAYLNDDVVDAIGAGDSFNAGFISRFVKKESLLDCLEFGVLTGAVNTTAAGGTGAFTSLEAVKACLKSKFNKTIINYAITR